MIACTFLPVSLKINAMSSGVKIRQRRKKPKAMTRSNGLGDAYTTTLNQVGAQKGDKSVLGLKVLIWVLNSERPVKVVEH